VRAPEAVQICAHVALDKKATDVLILQVDEVIGIADYFVLATARNKRQLSAIAEQIRIDLKALGGSKDHIEGYGSDRWVLLDFGSIVVHLFDAETRAFYDLESLWADAPRVPVTEAPRLSGTDDGE